MLTVQNLHASINDKPILKGLDLTVGAGEVHAIMGPNGSGKSTFSSVLAGHPDYQVTSGQICLDGQDLCTLLPQERATLGVFLAFQYPVEMPGVNNASFLKAALNAQRKQRGEKPLDAMDFLKAVKATMKVLDMDSKFLNRSVNAGFSGGEKKRNEVLQMMMLQPKLAVLDETDSGLDIDALQIVAKGVNQLRNQERSFIVVTHYQRLLDYIVPDYVHVLAHGKIVESGDQSLAKDLEKKGYMQFSKQADPVNQL